MNSPVSSISIACLRPTLRASATLGVEQNRPKLTPLTANLALSAATARSHCATSWQPAAVAVACTLAITGCGSDTIDTIMRPHFWNSASIRSCVPSAPISFRSWPAQKPRPRAAITTTRTLASFASASKAD